MVYPVIKVSTFTPVESNEYPWIKPLAEYLSPLSCVNDIALSQSGYEEIDGSNGCISAAYETSYLTTALKVASYILSAGILPLLAALTLVALRCCYQFHWIQEINEPVAPEPPVDLPEPVTNSTARSFSPDRFTQLGPDVTAHILTFLDRKDLRICASVSTSVSSATNVACQRLCNDNVITPVNLPTGGNYTKFWLNSNTIGPNFYREYFGEVEEAPPIPQAFIDREQVGFKLLYIPEYITIAVDGNSPLMLSKRTITFTRTVITGTRLVENAERAPRRARKIRVPVTLQNIFLLAAKYLKKNLPSQLGSVKQHEFPFFEIAGTPSHWSYQKEDPIGAGFGSYRDLVQLARAADFEISSLRDRMLFYLLSYIHSGIVPQREWNIEYVSPLPQLDDPGVNLNWNNSFDYFRIRFMQGEAAFLNANEMQYPNRGAAVQVPAENSQTIDDRSLHITNNAANALNEVAEDDQPDN